MLTLADNGVYRSTVAAIAAKQYPCLYKQGCVDGGWLDLVLRHDVCVCVYIYIAAAEINRRDLCSS